MQILLLLSALLSLCNPPPPAQASKRHRQSFKRHSSQAKHPRVSEAGQVECVAWGTVAQLVRGCGIFRVPRICPCNKGITLGRAFVCVTVLTNTKNQKVFLCYPWEPFCSGTHRMYISTGVLAPHFFQKKRALNFGRSSSLLLTHILEYSPELMIVNSPHTLNRFITCSAGEVQALNMFNFKGFYLL